MNEWKCERCFHKSVCMMYQRTRRIDDEPECGGNFADTDNVVHLPFKLGESVYIIVSRVNEASYIRKVTITAGNYSYYVDRLKDGAVYMTKQNALEAESVRKKGAKDARRT